MARRKKPDVPAYGPPREVEPDQALLEEVWRAAGHVKWMGDRIANWDLDPAEPLEPDQAVWLQQYQSERDRLVRTAKMVVDLGLAEKQIQLANKQAELVASALEAIFLGLELTAEQRRRIPDVVPTVLGELVGEEVEYQHQTDFGRRPELTAEIERLQ
jgi:hypothetical protein